MMLYYSVHYPKPEKEALLIDAMRHVGKIIKSLPGCLFDNAFQDGSLGTIMALTIWESQEVFQAARPAMIEALKAIPFDEWEARPREFHTLNSLVVNWLKEQIMLHVASYHQKNKDGATRAKKGNKHDRAEQFHSHICPT